MPYIGSPGNRTSLDDDQTQTDGTAEHGLGRQKSMALFPVLPLLAKGTCCVSSTFCRRVSEKTYAKCPLECATPHNQQCHLETRTREGEC